MANRFFVTGGAGFIGSNFVRMLLRNGYDVTNLDALTIAGVTNTIDELNAFANHSFVRGDIRDSELLQEVLPGHDIVVHFAAETHVDRSIDGPVDFLSTNVVGTGTLLEESRQLGVERFVHVSTDEVYGSIAEGFAPEGAPLDPSSPYSASKAGSDLLALSYATTYDFPVIVTRCTNNYGPYQFPEKVIPLFVTNLLQGKKIPLYGSGLNERDWLYVDDHCAALFLLTSDGEPGKVYNIGANAHMTNIDLTHAILDAMELDASMIEHVPDRPGHDLRYAVDSSRIRALGWKPEHGLAERLLSTIAWYSSRSDWWKPLV